ncbi:glycosyltransferase [Levilactobacillus bambusae]|uniref:Glycosyl transferase n=1 Tax=Levilactobacillus bambusae TaxID=2024736 RepID=A0A2V1MYZ5_9LACO|nr:glycosyltransferase [Levilactobacillus bambusae]PWF99707.1 glycosyl transferase [Levilactobacillus bambusae]
MNFFVNRTMGIGNSGVEHAEFYRAKLFDAKKIPYKYVFVEMTKNLHEAMDHWNIRPEQVINMWEYFVFGESYLDDGAPQIMKAKEEVILDSTNTQHRVDNVTSSGIRIERHMVKYPNDEPGKDNLLVSISRVQVFNAQTDEMKVEYEYTLDPRRGRILHNVHLYNFDESGDQLFFPNEVQLQRFFFQRLVAHFGTPANFMLDRGEESEAALLYHKPKGVHVMEVIHADHLSDRKIPTDPLWNNHYEYSLTHLDEIDRLVVATEMQRQDLLKDFPESDQKITAIPVGGVRNQDVTGGKEKKLEGAFKLVTVSRLADEKHIDIAIKAVAEAKKSIDVSLDIYGQGSQLGKLTQTIKDLDAEDYIHLMGHTNHPNEIYPQYDAFISASFSEGFGLTYIEALNADLPVITFDARFGALELIHEDENGVLVDFKRDDQDYDVAELAKGIIKAHDNYTELQKHTRQSTANYQDHVIADKWEALINGL